MDIQLKALIVEDVATEAELAVRELRQSGIYLDTHIVQNEATLREGLSTFQPDIILSDFTLPQFDGMRALRITREVSPDIPFIFVSGTIGEERAIEALRQGASDYVLKTNLKRLPQAIRQAIEHRRLALERLQAERLREESERKLRNIVDTIKEWIWEADADGMLSFSSGYAATLLGRRAESIIGTCVLDHVHPDDRASFLNALTLWHAEAPGSGIVHRWLHANHSIIWVESSASLLHDADHRVIGYRVASRDITGRKKHEDMLTRVSRAHELSSKTNAAIIRIRQRQALLQEICRIAVEAGNYDMARISLLDDNKENLRLVARAGTPTRAIDSLDLPLREDNETGAGITGKAVRDRKVLVSNDILHDKRPIYLREELLKLGFRALVAMPFIVKDQVVGVLNLASFQANVFQSDEMNILRDLVSDICYALEHLENEEKLNYVAYYDSLTGLANHDLFRERLAQTLNMSVGHDEKVLVVVWDIENLTDINNTFGRHVGDKLLQQIAQRLQKSTLGERSIAYFGGGKFAALMSVPGVMPDIQKFASEREVEFLRDACLIEGNELRVSARSGITVSSPDTSDCDSLIRNAEAALNSAKALRERMVAYTPNLTSRASQRLSLEARLHRALEQEQFLLYYQPKVRITDGGISGVEALIRWQDPELGLVPPVNFIAALEHSGMIVGVGRWVVKQAIRDQVRWRELGLPKVHIAINVSSAELHRGDFLSWLLDALPQNPDGDCGIDLEITESLLMQDMESSISKLNALRAVGMRVAIDDFGTGYSSLSYLARLPVDMLKIDRSFVSGITADSDALQIISTIVSLASALDLVTIAEGVENDEQYQLLKRMRCDEVQGYLFSKPLPGPELDALLARGRYPIPVA